MTYGVKSSKSTSQPLSLTSLGMAIEEFAGGELLVPVMRKGFKMSSDKIELKVLLLAIFSMAKASI
jgi:hypothetical protein